MTSDCDQIAKRVIHRLRSGELPEPSYVTLILDDDGNVIERRYQNNLPYRGGAIKTYIGFSPDDWDRES